MKFNTKTIHGGLSPDEGTGAIMTPIFQTSTYVQSSPGEHKGYEYSRSGNPTRAALETNIASIENGKYGLCFASGLAATDTLLKLFNSGDEIISTNDLYGGTFRLFTKVFEKYGLKFHFTGMEAVDQVESLINENTKMIWIETPTNPMLNIVDIEAMVGVAKKHNIMVCVDNTFASPYLQRPLDLGADLVMHSVTKYLGGHSDVVMGAIVVNDDKLAEDLYFLQNSSGAVCGPMDSFLVLRGIKTLHLRVQRSCENAKEIAHFLLDHPEVDKVYWPGFEDHPNHDVAKRQMDGFGGMVSFTVKGDFDRCVEVVSNTKVFSLAESLGGVESLVGHPASMTHASIPKVEREKCGVVDTLVRLSVGVEDIDDLISDLKNALNK